MKMITVVVATTVAIAIAVYTVRGLFRSPDLANYYPPTVYAASQHRSISISVEIEKKGDKVSFVNLFNVYGFSGNGPSIEQVVRANTKLHNVTYDSEGDMFAVVASDQNSYLQALNEINAITQIESLGLWLKKAAWIPIKE